MNTRLIVKYQITVEVDEQQLREVTEDRESSVQFLVEQEAGWMSASGISVVKVEELPGDHNRKESFYNQLESFISLTNRLLPERSLLQCWVEYPEVISLVFEGEYDYDREGTFFAPRNLKKIEFVNEAARVNLIKRMMIVDDWTEEEIYNYQPDNCEWLDTLWGGVPEFVSPELCGQVLERPADPVLEITNIDRQIDRALIALAQYQQSS